jgi:hypothetical protein
MKELISLFFNLLLVERKQKCFFEILKIKKLFLFCRYLHTISLIPYQK